MKYKCLIAENNLLERDLLEVLLRQIEQVDLVAICNDGLEAMQVLLAQEIDIVFTDIDMPKLSGINLLQSLKKPPVFIFISAYAEYAVDGFDLDVADFIVKPVKAPRLFKAFSKAKEIIERQVKKETHTTPEHEVFIAKTSEGLQKLSIIDIVFAESKANFSVLHLKDGRELMVLVNLKHLEEQLPANDFIRIHRHYVINWQHVATINTGGVSLAGNYQLPIGEAFRKSVSDKVGEHKILTRDAGK